MGTGPVAGVEPGMAAGVLTGALAAPDAGAVAAAPSKTLVPVLEVRRLPKYAKAKVATKKTVANTAVARDKKLALPDAPNRLPDEPLPNAAPMSAPLPCWIKIKTIIATAEIICTANMRFNRKLVTSTPQNEFNSSAQQNKAS